MRAIFSSTDFTEVGYYKSILDTAGIASFVQNENDNNPAMSGAMFYPVLCVIDDADYDKAISLLKSQQIPTAGGTADWTCLSCSEKNPANFEICWKCSSPRPVA